MIAFACPHCGKGLQVKDELAGKRGKCPQCQQPLTVPTPSGIAAEPAGPAPAEPPPPAAPDASEVVPPSHHVGQDSETEIGRLGGYRVLKVLGQGGRGGIFLAEDTRLGRKVALKAMLPSLAASESARQRFLREARTMAAVRHEHVAEALMVGEDRGFPFLAMELLQGEALEGRLKREGRLPLAEVLRIGREIAEGLQAVHAAGLIHRDVRPANVWLEAPRGWVKILDFGLARAAYSDPSLTRPGSILGTPGYMAPEQARGQPVDHRCDLFSLGCVLYRVATGELPFQGKDTVATLMAGATQQPRPLRDLNPEVPPALAGLVGQLLAKDPAGRPASARAVADELGALEKAPAVPPAAEAAAPMPTTPPAEGSPMSEEKKHGVLGKVLASAFGAVVALLLVALIIRHLNTAATQPAPPLPGPTVTAAPPTHPTPSPLTKKKKGA